MDLFSKLILVSVCLVRLLVATMLIHLGEPEVVCVKIPPLLFQLLPPKMIEIKILRIATMISYLLLLLNVLPDQEEEPHLRINNFLFGCPSKNEQFLKSLFILTEVSLF